MKNLILFKNFRFIPAILWQSVVEKKTHSADDAKAKHVSQVQED